MPQTTRPLASKKYVASVLALSVAVAVVLGNIFFLDLYRTTEEESARRHAMVATQALELFTAALVRSVDLAYLGIEPQLQDSDLVVTPGQGNPRIGGLLQTIKHGLPTLSVLGIVDANGHYIYHSDPASVGVSVADREYFTRQRIDQSPAATTIDLLFGKTTKKWTLVITRRLIFADGRFAGLIVSGLDLDALQDFMARIELPPEARLTIRDRNFRVAVSYPPNHLQRGEVQAPHLFLGALQRKEMEGFALGLRSSGEESIGWFRYSKDVPLIFTTTIPTDAYLARWQTVALVSCALLGLVVLLIGMVLRAVHLGRRQENALRRSDENLRQAQAVAGLCSWRYDVTERTLTWSREAERFFVGRVPRKRSDMLKMVHPDDVALVDQKWNEARQGCTVDFIHRMYVDSKLRWVRARANFSRTLADTEWGVGVIQDVTQEHAQQEELRLAASVFEYADEGIMITAPDGVILDVNRAMERITGYTRNELRGQRPNVLKSGVQPPEFYENLWPLLQSAGAWSGDLWNRNKAGKLYTQHTSIVAVRDDVVGATTTHYIAMVTDVTAAREDAEMLARMAYYDILTDLPNRRLFAEQLQAAAHRVARDGGSIAVGYLDLDGFKDVNDLHGHATGDTLLREVAQRLSGASRDGDIVARLGGDEFAILAHVDSVADCDQVMNRLLAEVARPYLLRDPKETGPAIPATISTSIGLTVYPQDQADPETLLRHADQAMYSAKRRGKNCYYIFDTASEEQAHEIHRDIGAVKRGMDRGEFLLHYQPKVDMVSGGVIGAEALARWERDGELVSPALFLHLVEAGHLTHSFGKMVLRAAFEQEERWLSQGLTIPISVNIFAQQLLDPDFPVMLARMIENFPTVAPQMIDLEIVETNHVGSFADASRTIRTCRAMGVTFSIDDFGTGWSSLSYLKHLPVNTMKIDQSFVRDILEDEEDLKLVSAVLGLARNFGCTAIAEGVETIDHGSKLIEMGCRFAQGYAISRPMPAADFEVWLAQWQCPPQWRRTSTSKIIELVA